MAHVDVSTGEFRVTEMDAAEVAGALEHLGAREVLFPADLPLLTGESPATRFLRTELEDWIFSFDYADRTPARSFPAAVARWLRPGQRAAAVGAAGAILHYLRDTQRAALDHLDRPTYYDRAESMVLDAVTVRNLELVEPLFAGREAKTAARRARPDADRHGRPPAAPAPAAALARPRRNRGAAGRRGRTAAADHPARRTAQGAGRHARSGAPAGQGHAWAPPARAICWRSAARSRRFPQLKQLLRDPAGRRACARSARPVSTRCRRSRDRILEAIADEPPVNLADGGTIRAGFNAELDELRDLSRNGRQYIAQIEARERTRTGIQSLKVRFNNVFGYYIEISNANLHLAPADYERKQTLVNAERFTTPELKDYERKVLDAEEKILALEKELFAEVRKFAAAHAQRIRATAAADRRTGRHGRAGAGGGRESLRAARVFRDPARCASLAGRHPVIETPGASRKPAASSPTISTSTIPPTSSPSSPAPTWAASPPICARPR